MKQHLTTVAQIKNEDEYALIFGLIGYSATKLYNTAIWERRNAWESGEKTPNYNQQSKDLKSNRWYKSLHSQSAQAILEEIDNGYQAFFSKHKSGDMKAKPPGFRKKDSLSTVTFKRDAIHLYEGNMLRLSIPKKTYGKQYIYLHLGLRPNLELTQDNIRLARLVENKGTWCIHITYEVEYIDEISLGSSMAIDLGIPNLATCVYQDGTTVIYSGRELRSIERYFHKEKSKCTKSTSKKCRALNQKRSRQRKHFLHAVTAKIVSDAKDRGISTIVIGNLNGIRENKNWGAKGNQQLHGWSYQMITQMITYKARRYNISITLIGERDTSSTCCHCGEKKNSNRIYRGLYACSNCEIVTNADVNGATNILKKYLHVFKVSLKETRVVGTLACPLVNLFVQRKSELDSREQGTFRIVNM